MFALLAFVAAIAAPAASDDASKYLDQVERRIMAVWRLPEKSDGRKVGLRMNLERSGRISDVRVETSSGDEKFDASAVEAVRRASPFAPVPEAAKHMVGDLRMILDPTLPAPKEETPKASKPAPAQPAPRAPVKPAPKKVPGQQI